ncbi:MAG: biotin carboxylase N-terminal domain-containing protein [Hyphomicrobiaceae bacterium]
MLKKILIANRGEIARRIIRTARQMGIATVAVYSDADASALHVEEADEAIHIGPSPATDSYLRGDKIIAAAKATGADGIHPGYGFLSENADFAQAVAEAGLTFVGPTAAAMRALGGKAAAKEVAIKADVPVVPGYQGEKQDAPSLAAEAKKIGYPVMIKAVAGGGGRGMRAVEREADMAELLASAQREAAGAFGDARVLIEKVVVRPRHIEVQVFGDAHGNVVHLFERDCTLQRRNQKVIEEAPAPGMSPELREKMCGAAVKLAKAVGYRGAGTVEFLVEGGSLDAQAKWYFIEMNTRLQVEHPVTEEITGLDLVEWQLRVASGENLPLPQDKITMSRHAIEARLCAEDPSKGFLPGVGRIREIWGAGEVERLEIGVRSGDEISPFYDSMIAKLIASGSNRDIALQRLTRSLEGFIVFGPATNGVFLRRLLQDSGVKAGVMDTGLIGREIDRLSQRMVSDAEKADTVAELLRHEREAATPASSHHYSYTGWAANDAFQLGGARTMPMKVVIDGEPQTATVTWPAAARGSTGFAWPSVSLGGAGVPAGGHRGRQNVIYDGTVYASFDGELVTASRPVYDASAVEDGHAGDTVRAPINGKVARIFVAEGDTVAKGDRIAVVEAMKMEHVVHAGRDGTIGKVAVSEGAQVNQGALIAALTEIS